MAQFLTALVLINSLGQLKFSTFIKFANLDS